MIDMSANIMQSVNYQLEPRSPHMAWQIGPRTEKLEEDKNDSGVASPGSDSSQEQNYQSPRPQGAGRFCSTPMVPSLSLYGVNPYLNPLTPPNSEPLVSPKSEKDDTDNTLTPCGSPAQIKGEDHIRRLEMTLEKNLLLSKSESMDEMSNKSDTDEFDESLRVPKVNSHGKIKMFKCKQCDFVANTKIDQWNHTRTHIREDKILTCPKCPFVTEYKHHLEYHLRNHAGSKPFQCNKCDYSCVNKSMLNSHQKSHSSVYRFSCRDCNYATKYCHSLKLHLRRYQHSPGVVLDDEGKPCPDVIIDVYGTRRGPKLKSKNEERPRSELHPYLVPSPQLPFPPYPFLGAQAQVQLLQRLFQERQALAEEPEPSKVLDLSKPGSSDQQKSRRKGPAFRIDPAASNDSEDEEDMSTTMFSNVEAVVKEEKDTPDVVAADSNNNKEEEKKSCQYCDISFGNDVMYTIHMGYHGYNNPFTCNMCGTDCPDKVTFFLHLARVAHS